MSAFLKDVMILDRIFYCLVKGLFCALLGLKVKLYMLVRLLVLLLMSVHRDSAGMSIIYS